MRNFRIVSLASSLMLLAACEGKPEPAADKPAELAKVEGGQPTGANPETPVIEGQGEVAKPEPKPVEPKPVSPAVTPPAGDEDEEEEENPYADGTGMDDADADYEVQDGDDVDDREPPPYPAQVGSDPPAFVHPPAKAILVVASTRSYSPGETAVDRDAKYHTWIWRPSAGPLPTKGKALGPVAEDGTPTGPALVEEVDGLIVSDGSGLTQLSFEEVTVNLARCECDEMEEGGWVAKKGDLAKKLFEMRSTPLGAWEPGVAPTPAGEAKVMVAATDYRRESGMDCVTDRQDVEHVMQVFSVTGSKVLVVERVYDNAACSFQGYELRSQRMFDLSGASFDLAALERELPYKTVKTARTKAQEELDGIAAASAYDLAAVNLILTGVFPKFREHKGGVRLLLQYSAKGDPTSEGEGGWGNGWDSHVVTVAYPESSSLTAPAPAMQLIEYVQREGGSKWKVIGWSQIHEGGVAPTPGAPPVPAGPPASE